MKEEWKPIKDYEGLYEVSNYGNVRSLKRNTAHERILKPMFNKDGYMQVCLCKNNHRKTYRIHRLVAVAFVDGYSESNCVVNHKNEIKTDNRSSNLEWCDVLYNTNYRNMNFRRMQHRRVPIIAIKDDEILHFNGIVEASKILKVSHSNISSCLHGRYGHKSIKGYRFKYDKEQKN